MTEKEIKSLINQQPALDKLQIDLLINDLTTIFKDNLSKQAQLIKVVSKLWVLPFQRNIEIAIYLAIDSLENNLSISKIGLNEIENVLYYSNQFTNIERNNQQQIIKGLYKDYQLTFQPKYLNCEHFLNLKVEYEEQRFKIYDQLINQYPLFRNTLTIIDNILEQEQIKTISSEFIIILLGYGIERFSFENKYYSYLTVFGKALDDFIGSKPIYLTKYLNQETIKTDDKYYLDDLRLGMNLASSVNDLNIGDYRKLRKKVSKICEIDEDNKINLNSSEIVLEIKTISDQQSLASKWHYHVIGSNLSNSGGEYYDTADSSIMLKGLFKGLKALVDNQLVNKPIVIKSMGIDLFDPSILNEPEDRSRIKTIRKLIEANKLNIKNFR